MSPVPSRRRRNPADSTFVNGRFTIIGKATPERITRPPVSDGVNGALGIELGHKSQNTNNHQCQAAPCHASVPVKTETGRTVHNDGR